MSVRMRLAVRGLAPLLDLGQEVQVVGAEISGDFLDLELEGVRLAVVPNTPLAHQLAASPPEEVTAEYLVVVDATTGHARRQFTRFKLPEGAPVVPVGEGTVPVDVATGQAVDGPPATTVAVEETTPPSGPGSRGGKAGGS